MEKTAVEWLEDQVIAKDWLSEKGKNIFKQAKEMEKQQIMDAWVNGGSTLSAKNAEQYYNEKFK